MAVAAVAPESAGTPGAPAGTTAMGLRTLLRSGEQFRDRRAQELQLGPRDMTALGHLYHEGPMAPGKLASMLGVTSGTMTALLDRVEGAGFLRRTHHPHDRRSLLITLTPAGDHAMQWLYGQYETVIREALSRVPGLDQQQFHVALQVLSTALDESAEHDAPSGSPTPDAPTGARPIPGV